MLPFVQFLSTTHRDENANKHRNTYHRDNPASGMPIHNEHAPSSPPNSNPGNTSNLQKSWTESSDPLFLSTTPLEHPVRAHMLGDLTPHGGLSLPMMKKLTQGLSKLENYVDPKQTRTEVRVKETLQGILNLRWTGTFNCRTELQFISQPRDLLLPDLIKQSNPDQLSEQLIAISRNRESLTQITNSLQ